MQSDNPDCVQSADPCSMDRESASRVHSLCTVQFTSVRLNVLNGVGIQLALMYIFAVNIEKHIENLGTTRKL